MKKNKFKILYIIIFAVFLVIMNKSIDNANMSKEEEQMNSLKDAIHKSAVQCYAIEGFYPPDVKYLQENYGLIVDKEKYAISYSVFAENILPEIEVFKK